MAPWTPYLLAALLVAFLGGLLCRRYRTPPF